MTWMVRTACGVVLAAMLTSAATPAIARDDTLPDVLVDGFYGGLIGALLGTAVMVMTEHPRDHLGYITTGAALGAIGGTGYGLAKITRYSMIDIDRQRIAWHVPTVDTTTRTVPGEPTDVRVSAALITVNFR
ncbi:MAG TPA: hypothetical protein VFN94_00840 [Nitrospiria bacterium]|nr:hypothetical protein [Nitrospiria bacterium]